MDIFKSLLLERIQGKLFDILLEEIRKDRTRVIIDDNLMKRIIGMVHASGMYEKFQLALLSASQSFFQHKFDSEMNICASRSHSESDRHFVGEYLLLVQLFLAEENNRINRYLLELSRVLLAQNILDTALIKYHGQIIDLGLIYFCDTMKIESLKLLFSLFTQSKGLDFLIPGFKNYIKKKIENFNLEAEFIEGLLHFKSRVDIILSCFDHLECFLIALKESFEEAINAKGSKPAELLAKFVDEKMKKGSSEEEIEGILDKCLNIFRFLKGKDTFEAFYEVYFAKRLLTGKSSSVDSEASMISKLKTECGPGYTSKLEGMLKDVDLSKDIISSFRDAVKFSGTGNDVDFSTMILTTGFWPSFPTSEVKMPAYLQKYEDNFRDFYVSKYSGRKIAYQRSLGNCIVKAYFPNGTKELQVSFLQAIILEQFNEDCQEISAQQISEATGIEGDELIRNLQTLACGKLRVLEKDPKGKDVAMTDLFRMNESFSAKLYRLKINTIQLKETAQECVQTNTKVAQDRQYQIDAAIVRVMKTRKSISHNQLISELFSVLKFPCKANDLKKRIESLIEREYIERDKSNSSIYCYVA